VSRTASACGLDFGLQKFKVSQYNIKKSVITSQKTHCAFISKITVLTVVTKAWAGEKCLIGKLGARYKEGAEQT
jgi:hypothetical protein